MNCGSLPHSHFWWLRKELFNLYIRPQTPQSNPVPSEDLCWLFLEDVVRSSDVLVIVCSIDFFILSRISIMGKAKWAGQRSHGRVTRRSWAGTSKSVRTFYPFMHMETEINEAKRKRNNITLLILLNTFIVYLSATIKLCNTNHKYFSVILSYI